MLTTADTHTPPRHNWTVTVQSSSCVLFLWSLEAGGVCTSACYTFVLLLWR